MADKFYEIDFRVSAAGKWVWVHRCPECQRQFKEGWTWGVFDSQEAAERDAMAVMASDKGCKNVQSGH